MAIVKYIGKGELPADFEEKEKKAFLSAAGMPESVFRKKVMDFRHYDDIALKFHADRGRFGRAYRKAALSSGEAHRRHILKRK
jgi:hypothetical protein